MLQLFDFDVTDRGRRYNQSLHRLGLAIFSQLIPGRQLKLIYRQFTGKILVLLLVTFTVASDDGDGTVVNTTVTLNGDYRRIADSTNNGVEGILEADLNAIATGSPTSVDVEGVTMTFTLSPFSASDSVEQKATDLQTAINSAISDSNNTNGAADDVAQVTVESYDDAGTTKFRITLRYRWQPRFYRCYR